MPKKIENALKKVAKKKYPGNKAKQNALIYGTLRHKYGWKPKREM